jgi:hypothetical protein
LPIRSRTPEYQPCSSGEILIVPANLGGPDPDAQCGLHVFAEALDEPDRMASCSGEYWGTRPWITVTSGAFLSSGVMSGLWAKISFAGHIHVSEKRAGVALVKTDDPVQQHDNIAGTLPVPEDHFARCGGSRHETCLRVRLEICAQPLQLVFRTGKVHKDSSAVRRISRLAFRNVIPG